MHFHFAFSLCYFRAIFFNVHVNSAALKKRATQCPHNIWEQIRVQASDVIFPETSLFPAFFCCVGYTWNALQDRQTNKRIIYNPELFALHLL